MLRNACHILSTGLLVVAVGSLSSCGSDEPAAAPTGSNAGAGGSATPDASAGGGTGGKGTGGAGGTTDGGKDASGPACGNGKLDPGEACDTSIAAGRTGACPSASTCDDGDACTKDVLSGDGTCSARCDST